jgi:hypothetical protein
MPVYQVKLWRSFAIYLLNGCRHEVANVFENENAAGRKICCPCGRSLDVLLWQSPGERVLISDQQLRSLAERARGWPWKNYELIQM